MLLYIKNNIQYQKLGISSIVDTNSSEIIIAVEFMLNKNIILACVYRSPNLTPDNSSDINKSFC